jgi:hypothetical protein
MRCAIFASAAQASGSEIKSDIPLFVEEAKQAGIEHIYGGPWEYYVGGGIAAFDCNGDRFPDLAMAGGLNPTGLYINQSKPGDKLQFGIASQALPDQATRNVTGIYPVDFNNDGIKDLVVLRVGKNLLLEGGVDCQFKIVNNKVVFDGGHAWTTAFSATFEADQSYPTLAFGNYVDRSAPGSPWGTCDDNYLFRPVDNISLRYGEPQILSPGYCALSMLFTDWNRSGLHDLRITNDRHYYRGGEEQLWNIPSQRPARAYRSSEGWRRVMIWGMGIAETDLNADGYPEYALTSMGDTKLQTLDTRTDPPRPTYRDIAFEKGATAHRPYVGAEIKPSTGWHAEFADFNNDGRQDLYIAKGNVEAMPDFAHYDPDNLLLLQADGRFQEAGSVSGIDKNTIGRGAAIVDLNMDGMLDLVVVNRKAPASIFRNRGNGKYPGINTMGNWLAIELRQAEINRDAVGALISIKTGNKVQTRRVQIGGGHASGKLGFVHVGLGVAERASIRIKWPDDQWSHSYRIFANNFAIIERGAEQVNYWYPVQYVVAR